MTVVIHIKDSCGTNDEVYIGRPSKWGNPFILKYEKDRSKIISQYKDWILEKIKNEEITKEDILTLKDKRLMCYCKPRACHGDILVALVNYYDRKD